MEQTKVVAAAPVTTAPVTTAGAPVTANQKINVKIANDSDELLFTIKNIDVSIANSLRRAILMNIPRLVISNVVIETNTSAHFHNEIIKHRMGCLPINALSLETPEQADQFIDNLVENYYLFLEVENTNAETIYVTTEDLQLILQQGKTPQQEIKITDLFRPYMTYYIDILRLGGKYGDISGEKIKLTAHFSKDQAQTNGSYSVVSRCSYMNTPDIARQQEEWTKIETKEMAKLPTDATEQQRAEWAQLIKFKKNDFFLLDAERIFIENSFDYVIQCNENYSNRLIVLLACRFLIQEYSYLVGAAPNLGTTPPPYKIIPSNEKITSNANETSTMENSFDILLEKDYTVGYVLDYLMFTKYFVKNSAAGTINPEFLLNYCGFTKFHPHQSTSILRIAFKNKPENPEKLIEAMMNNICDTAIEIITFISKNFG